MGMNAHYHLAISSSQLESLKQEANSKGLKTSELIKLKLRSDIRLNYLENDFKQIEKKLYSLEVVIRRLAESQKEIMGFFLNYSKNNLLIS